MTRYAWIFLTAAFGALCLPIAAAATTLEELMDACVQVLERGDFTGVAPYGVQRLEQGFMGSTHKIDGGTVTLIVQNDQRDDTIHSCSIQGYTWGDDDTILKPGLTFAQAEDRIRAWFALRNAKPGNADMTKVILAGGSPFHIVSCPGPGEGFWIQGQPGMFGSKTNDVPEPERPAVFIAVQSANDHEQACNFYKQYGPGG